jgi:hypothetical protein
VLGGVVVELHQHVEVVGELRDRLGPLGAVLGHEGAGSGLGVLAVFGVQISASAAHDSEDSRCPSVSATSSLVPSARTPIITSRQTLS